MTKIRKRDIASVAVKSWSPIVITLAYHAGGSDSFSIGRLARELTTVAYQAVISEVRLHGRTG